MPTSRQPVRLPQLARIAAAAAVVAVVVGVVYFLTTKRVPLLPRATSCTATADRQQLSLTVSQAGIAATIAGVAAKHDLPARAVTIAYATALQESKLSDLDYGDLDSVGVFQQRPSEGWGTAKEIENPVYASTRFFTALEAVPGYLHMPVYKAAQAVQRSADGYAYQQYASVGAQLANAFTGEQPHALWCYYAAPMGKPKLAAADSALSATFGYLPSRDAGDPERVVQIRQQREGWAVAAWLITHASSYGIKNVRYLGYEWTTSGDGAGKWTRLPTSGRTQAAPTGLSYG